MAIKKKKKLILLAAAQSRLSDVFDESVDSIEFVRISGETLEGDTEVETINEQSLTTDEVDALNLSAGIRE